MEMSSLMHGHIKSRHQSKSRCFTFFGFNCRLHLSSMNKKNNNKFSLAKFLIHSTSHKTVFSEHLWLMWTAVSAMNGSWQHMLCTECTPVNVWLENDVNQSEIINWAVEFGKWCARSTRLFSIHFRCRNRFGRRNRRGRTRQQNNLFIYQMLCEIWIYGCENILYLIRCRNG